MVEPSWFFRYTIIIIYFFPYISNSNKVQCVRVSGGCSVVVRICGRSLQPHRSLLKLSHHSKFFSKNIYLFSFLIIFLFPPPYRPTRRSQNTGSLTTSSMRWWWPTTGGGGTIPRSGSGNSVGGLIFFTLTFINFQTNFQIL